MTQPADRSGTESGLVRWLGARGRWQRLGLAIILGAALTAGHPPVSVPWIFFLAVPLLVLLALSAPTGRAAAWIGWGAAFGYFVTGLHWIGHAFLVDAERFAWLLPIGVTALPTGLGLFWALAFWLARRLRPVGVLPAAVVLVSLWTLAEYTRSNVLTGLPWALPGYVWVDLPPMQAAAWVGPFGVTFLTFLITSLPVMAWVGGRRTLVGAAALAAGAGLWLAGALRVPDAVAYAPDAPVLRVVQPNAPQHLKWLPGHREEFYARLLSATGAPPDPGLGPPDIVIWPEASVHFVPAAEPREVARISRAAGRAWVLLGALHGERTRTGERWTNALVTIGPDGSLGPRYDKHHLVPFGEYLPLKSVFDALGISQFAVRGGFESGPGPQTLRLDGVPSFSPLICYEAIFPNEIVGAERPEWLLQPTNDAWFGSWAGPRQHYAQARIRAIEQGLPMVRAANTGISAVVDPYGREVVSIELHNYRYLDYRLPKSLRPTFYSFFGDWPILAIMIAFVVFAAINTRRAP